MAASVARELAVLISGSNAVSPALKQLRQDLEGVGGQVKQTGQEATKASKSFDDLLVQGAKLGAGFVGVTSATAVMGKLTASVGDAIKNASDLNETVNKSDVVFGSASGAVKAFGDTAAQSLGQSKQQAIAAASDFGNLFKSMGQNQRAAADMSIGMVKLAGDLASFHNIDSASALEKLRAGLVGEAEPLRTLGVLLSEEAVKLEAVRMGLVAKNAELSESQKVQARYSLIMQQTADAQGDFARTSDGLANAQRIVGASMADLSATIGKELLPAAAAITNSMAKSLPDAIAEAKKSLDGIRPVLKFTGDAFGTLGGAIQAAGGAGFIFTTAIDGMVPGLRALIGLLDQYKGAAAEAPAPNIPGWANPLSIAEAGRQEADTAAVNAAADARKKFEEAAKSFETAMRSGTAAAVDDAEAMWESRRMTLLRAEAQEKAEKANNKMAASTENAREKAEDLARTIEERGAEAIQAMTEAGEKHGQAINEAILDTANAISQATQQAMNALDDMETRERISGDTSRRRTELNERLSGEQRIFGQRMDDEEFHHQESLKLARINADEQKKLAGEKDERQRQVIRITAQQERDALQQAHVDHDAEVAWRISQEDKVINQRKDWERQRADLERTLHEEELEREKTRIEARKKAAIDAANAEYVDKKTKADKELTENLTRAGSLAVGSLTKMKTDFLDKLPEAAKAGSSGLATLLDNTLGATVRGIWDTIANIQSATGTGGGGGEGGGWVDGNYVDPRHQPGGDIFEEWKRNEPKQYEEWVNEHTEGRASGGPVVAGRPYWVGERGPELIVPRSAGTVVPAGGGVTQIIQMNGNYVGFDRTSLENLARELKPYLDSLVRL